MEIILSLSKYIGNIYLRIDLFQNIVLDNIQAYHVASFILITVALNTLHASTSLP